MLKNIFWLKLVVLLVLILLTRFWKLGEVPLHLTQDEVAVGYEAYSILKTSRDEWGAKYPLQFRSVGDYKQPVLIYLVAVSEKFLGMNELAVRLPSAVFSALMILVLWWGLGRWVFRDGWIAWLVAVLVTLSPWHIAASRTSHDVVVGLFFVIANLFDWFGFLREKRLKWLWRVVLSGMLAVMSYHSMKVFVPAFGLVMVMIFRGEVFGWLRKQRGWLWWGSLLIWLILGGWVINNFMLGKAMSRGEMTFLSKDFDYARVLLPAMPAGRQAIGAWVLEWMGKVALLMGFWWRRYLEYFSVSFYWLEGLGLTLKDQPSQGVLLWGEVVWLIVGILVVLRGKMEKILKEKWIVRVLLIYWLLSFLPASLANNAKHAYRSSLAMPVIYVLIVIGLREAVGWFKGRMKAVVVGLILLGYGVGVVRFADYYLVHYPTQLSEYRGYPWAEVAKFVYPIKGQYEKVVIDPRFGTEGPYNVGVPQYYFLFYGQYDPERYLAREMKGLDTYDFENLIFAGIEWQKENKRGVLYVGSPWSFQTREGVSEEQVLRRFKFKNGVEGIWVVEGEK